MSKPKTRKDDSTFDERAGAHDDAGAGDVRALTHEETEARALEAFKHRFHVKCGGAPVASAPTEEEANALCENLRAAWLVRMQHRGKVRIVEVAEGQRTEHWRRAPFDGANAWSVEDTEPPSPDEAAPPDTDGEHGEPLHATDAERPTQP